MAKGQPLSRYQKGIVNRYYEHLDTIALGKLGEAVGELYLASDAKKIDKLWVSVEKALAKVAGAGGGDPSVRTIIASRDVKGLAKLVNDLSAK